jgi:hypothetical protein
MSEVGRERVRERARERERDRKREGRGSTSLGVSSPEWRVLRAHAIQIKAGPKHPQKGATLDSSIELPRTSSDRTEFDMPRTKFEDNQGGGGWGDGVAPDLYPSHPHHTVGDSRKCSTQLLTCTGTSDSRDPPSGARKRIARLEDCAWVVTRMGGLRMDRRTMGGRACTAARWDCPQITTRWDMITARGYPTGLLLANACCARRACSSAAEPWTGGSRGGEVMLAIACCARRTCQSLPRLTRGRGR